MGFAAEPSIDIFRRLGELASWLDLIGFWIAHGGHLAGGGGWRDELHFRMDPDRRRFLGGLPARPRALRGGDARWGSSDDCVPAPWREIPATAGQPAADASRAARGDLLGASGRVSHRGAEAQGLNAPIPASPRFHKPSSVCRNRGLTSGGRRWPGSGLGRGRIGARCPPGCRHGMGACHGSTAKCQCFRCDPIAWVREP